MSNAVGTDCRRFEAARFPCVLRTSSAWQAQISAVRDEFYGATLSACDVTVSGTREIGSNCVPALAFRPSSRIS